MPGPIPSVVGRAVDPHSFFADPDPEVFLNTVGAESLYRFSAAAVFIPGTLILFFTMPQLFSPLPLFLVFF